MIGMFFLFSAAIFAKPSIIQTVREVIAMKYTDAFRDIDIDDCMISDFNATSKTRCLIHCLQESECVSFAYNPIQCRCRLYRVTFKSAIGLGTITGWIFYHVKGPSCPGDFVLSRKACICFKYYPPNSALDSYQSKSDVCAGAGGALVKIDNQSKQDVLANYLNSISTPLRTMIQGRRVSGTMMYDDATPFTYYAWDIGDPEYYSYVCMYAPSFLWHDFNSVNNIKSAAFVCEIRFT